MFHRVKSWGTCYIYVNDLSRGLKSYLSLLVDNAELMREVKNIQNCDNLQKQATELVRYMATENQPTFKVTTVKRTGIRPRYDYYIVQEASYWTPPAEATQLTHYPV